MTPATPTQGTPKPPQTPTAPAAPPNFDRIARPYRWLEYLTLGPLLQRTRICLLPALPPLRRALILGDGDGRFTAALLALHPHLHANAVDASAAMLALLHRRAPRALPHHADALTFTPAAPPDLITSHFFLDCLTQPQLDALIPRLARTLPPGGLWLLSEFRIPPGPLRLPTRFLIRTLYLAFRLLTGLRVTHLPDYATPLRAAGLVPLHTHRRLFGILTSELWQLSAIPPPGQPALNKSPATNA